VLKKETVENIIIGLHSAEWESRNKLRKRDWKHCYSIISTTEEDESKGF
jgi:hypothetical protein